MKKILYSTISVFLIGAMFTSCSTSDSAMSGFSKRKYLKKFKPAKFEEKKVSSEEFAAVEKREVTFNYENKQVLNDEKKVGVAPIVLTRKEQKNAVKSVKQEIKNWSLYNREVVENYFAANSNSVEMQAASVNGARIETWVLAVLAIFIPPLAVYLYEDSFTGNFWLDLVLCLLFWLPGIIYAFLVIFADVSI